MHRLHRLAVSGEGEVGGAEPLPQAHFESERLGGHSLAVATARHVLYLSLGATTKKQINNKEGSKVTTRQCGINARDATNSLGICDSSLSLRG